jgi:N-acetylmuramoyl-L-alanine amidase
MNRLYRTAIAIVVGLVTWSGGLQLCGNWTASEAVTYDSLFPGVCLDAGHGGPGACKWAGPPDYCTNGGGYNEYRGCSGPNGLTEAWVNHEIVPLAMDAFATDNIYVACTRQTITDNIPYQTRCDLANNDASVDVFVSVHHEGSTEFQETRTFCKDDPDVPNPETGKWRYKIALALANEINRRFGYGMQVKVDTEAGHDSIFVLRNTWMPSALTEASSIGHESEEDLMANDYWHRRDEALGITDGFLAYADTLTCPQNFDCDCDEDADGYAYFWWDEVDLA